MRVFSAMIIHRKYFLVLNAFISKIFEEEDQDVFLGNPEVVTYGNQTFLYEISTGGMLAVCGI